jgi:ABC-type multidrug transport system ATPase subunit
LLLLDEPTSGLDSVQAFELAKLLKKESLRGLSILCTIHTPSAETFLQFDRCILLSEGYTIYNGPPICIREYFEEKGFVFEKY